VFDLLHEQEQAVGVLREAPTCLAAWKARTEPGQAEPGHEQRRLIGHGLIRTRPESQASTAAKAALRWSHQQLGEINVKGIGSQPLAKSMRRSEVNEVQRVRPTDFQFLVHHPKRPQSIRRHPQAFPGQIDGAVVSKDLDSADAASGEPRTRLAMAFPRCCRA